MNNSSSIDALIYNLIQKYLAGRGHKKIKEYLKIETKDSKKNKVLDQGCGTGEYSLQYLNSEYLGLDISKGYLKYAKEKFGNKFIIGDARIMPFKKNFFDYVISVGLYHHLNDKGAKKAINEAIRVTKVNGKVVIIDAAMPLNPFNVPGFILRKLDNGKYVRNWNDTIKLLPQKIDYQRELFSSFPFDYIKIIIVKH